MNEEKITEKITRPCGLCGRVFESKLLTGHHCLPKEKGGTWHDIVLICQQCHSMVHATFTTRTLAEYYYTLELLRKAPELQGFIKWVRKQPASRYTKNARRNQRI